MFRHICVHIYIYIYIYICVYIHICIYYIFIYQRVRDNEMRDLHPRRERDPVVLLAVFT